MKKNVGAERNQSDIKTKIRRRLVIALVIIIIGAPFLFAPSDVFAFGIGILGGMGVFEIWQISKNSQRHRDSLLAVLFAVYLCVSLFLCYRLRFSENGLSWLFFGVLLIGVFDSASYLGGKKFGKRKITPHISPKKTLEGLISGFIGCGVISLIVGNWLFSLFLWQLASIAVIVGTLAFFGDLFESLLKRKMQVKDSGSILKSHGGLLDRIDSALAVIYGLYFLKLWFF